MNIFSLLATVDQVVFLLLEQILEIHLLQSHQEIVMVMAMETLNILYHQDIIHLTQKT